MFQKIIHFTTYLIIFCLPLYLVHFRIGWVPFTLLEVMVYGLFVIWLLVKVTENGSLITTENRFLIAPIFLIFLGVTISTLLSTNLQTSAGIWKGWFVVPLLFFIVIITTNRQKIKNILTALFLSGTGVALVSLFYWLNNNLTYDGRLQAFYLSPNHLAMYLAPCLVLGLALWQFARYKWQKALLITCYMLYVICLYLTYSYGAWLGLIAALFFLLVSKMDKASFIYLISFILLLFILFFLWQIPSQKFQGILDFSYSSLKSRLMIWQSAWQITKDHSLIGIGPGMFQKYYLDYQSSFEPYLEWAVPQPHNLFLAFWLQTGLIGLIGFIWLFVVFFKSLSPKRLSVIIAAAMVYILIHGLIDTTFWKNDLSMIFWLLIALSCITNRFSYQ